MSGIIAQNTLDSSGLIKAPAGGGAWTFIKKLTASGSDDLTFVNGSSDVVLDSTYSIYCFQCINIHPSADSVYLQFQGNAVGGSGYNETMTTTFFRAKHFEDGSGGAVTYAADGDQANGTAFQNISHNIGVDNDQCTSGILYLFNPSSTTFVKHFIARAISNQDDNGPADAFAAGYFNTTSAIDAIRFKIGEESIVGTMDAGSISMYGLTI